MNDPDLQISLASKNDANEILELQKSAFLGQAAIYNNYELPPLTQTLESIENEFGEKTFLKAVSNGQVIGSVRFKQGKIIKVRLRKAGSGLTIGHKGEPAFDRYRIDKPYPSCP